MRFCQLTGWIKLPSATPRRKGGRATIELAARDPKAKVGVSVFCQPTWVNKLAARDPKAKEGVSVAKHKH